MTTRRRRLAVAVVLGSLAACSTPSADRLPPSTPGPGGAPSPSASTGSSGPAEPAEPAAFDWGVSEPRAAGFDRRRIDRLAAHARRAGSACFLVARGDDVVGEWYWRGDDAATSREVFSITKSVTSTLVGIAQGQGLLDVDDSAARYVRAWRGTLAAEVTVRDLLSNDSGREWSTSADYAGLIRAPRRTRYAVGLEQQHRPGEVWAYNNAAIQTLDRVLRGASGTTTDRYAAEQLFAPLGMADTFLTGDSSKQSTSTAFGLNSTCRDLARVGLLLARDGRWQDQQLLPAAWVRDAVGAPSQEQNAAYGLLWWLNREGPLRGPLDQTDPSGTPDVVRTGRMAPGAPAELFAALGFGGQVLLVDPVSDTVVVRLADATFGPATYTFADAARVVTEALRSAR